MSTDLLEIKQFKRFLCTIRFDNSFIIKQNRLKLC